MNNKKIIEHYIILSQKIRDKIVCEEELQEIMKRDIQHIEQLHNNKIITEEDYRSILFTVSEFEDLFIEILNKQINKQANERSK